MNSLTSGSSKRSYDSYDPTILRFLRFANFIDCYCSEPRLAFNGTVGHYRIALERHAICSVDDQPEDWRRYVGWDMNRPIAGSSALTSRQA